MFKTCDDTQIWFVQFTDQKKTAKKVTKGSLRRNIKGFLISQHLKTSNINTGHKCKMV